MLWIEINAVKTISSTACKQIRKLKSRPNSVLCCLISKFRILNDSRLAQPNTAVWVFLGEKVPKSKKSGDSKDVNLLIAVLLEQAIRFQDDKQLQPLKDEVCAHTCDFKVTSLMSR